MDRKGSYMAKKQIQEAEIIVLLALLVLYVELNCFTQSHILGSSIMHWNYYIPVLTGIISSCLPVSAFILLNMLPRSEKTAKISSAVLILLVCAVCISGLFGYIWPETVTVSGKYLEAGRFWGDKTTLLSQCWFVCAAPLLLTALWMNVDHKKLKSIYSAEAMTLLTILVSWFFFKGCGTACVMHGMFILAVLSAAMMFRKLMVLYLPSGKRLNREAFRYSAFVFLNVLVPLVLIACAVKHHTPSAYSADLRQLVRYMLSGSRSVIGELRTESVLQSWPSVLLAIAYYFGPSGVSLYLVSLGIMLFLMGRMIRENNNRLNRYWTVEICAYASLLFKAAAGTCHALGISAFGLTAVDHVLPFSPEYGKSLSDDSMAFFIILFCFLANEAFLQPEMEKLKCGKVLSFEELREHHLEDLTAGDDQDTEDGDDIFDFDEDSRRTARDQGSGQSGDGIYYIWDGPPGNGWIGPLVILRVSVMGTVRKVFAQPLMGVGKNGNNRQYMLCYADDWDEEKPSIGFFRLSRASGSEIWNYDPSDTEILIELYKTAMTELFANVEVERENCEILYD